LRVLPAARCFHGPAGTNLIPEAGHHTAPFELTAEEDYAPGVDAVNLKSCFRNVEIDCRDRLHG